jgi:hypothetical protein
MTSQNTDDTTPETEEHEERSPWWGVRRFVFSIGVLTIFIYSAQMLAPLLLGPSQDAHQAEQEQLAQAEALTPAPESPATETPIAEAPTETTAPVEASVVAQDMTEPPVALPSPNAPLATDDALNNRISALEEKIAAQDIAIEMLKEQLASSVTHAADKANAQLSTVVLLSQLRTELEQGQPYSAPLAALETTLAGNTKTETLLLRLAPARNSGLPTMETLKSGFAEKLKPALLAAKDSYGKTLGGLITIRKVGSPQGTDDEAVLARAETALRGGALGNALREVEQLSPPAADVLKPWVEQAKAYTDARAALDALYVAVSTAETQTP